MRVPCESQQLLLFILHKSNFRFVYIHIIITVTIMKYHRGWTLVVTKQT